MLVALGLAPGCDDLGCTPRPCLNIAEPPDRKDEKLDPCLSAEPDPKAPDRPRPCLKVGVPPKEPEAGPCLKVAAPTKEPVPVPEPPDELQPCLSDVVEPIPNRPPDKPSKPSGEGMARRDVIRRLGHAKVLPPDVAARLDEDA